jgi:hypothetical protein
MLKARPARSGSSAETECLADQRATTAGERAFSSPFAGKPMVRAVGRTHS